MLIRSLIVLLVVMNLGVAAWWLLHATPAPVQPRQPAGVPRLVLLAEAPGAAAKAAGPAHAGNAPAASSACAGAEAGAGGWRVYLPPIRGEQQADAIAARIARAGFSDYLVLRDENGVNAGIALGQYGTRDAAQRRVAALQAAGFAPRCARIKADSPA